MERYIGFIIIIIIICMEYKFGGLKIIWTFCFTFNGPCIIISWMKTI